ncbi:MAG: pilus assembly protein TadG-related protein [Acidobacteriota bacterium]
MLHLLWVRRLIAERRGATAVILALALVSILGFAGLATEVSLWYFTKRDMQDAADSSAYSAAAAKYKGENKQEFTAEADSVAGKFDFVHDVGGVTVTVNNPPASGNYTTDSNAIEVIITEPQTEFVSALFLANPPTVAARAVALTGTPGNGCVLALDGAAVDDVFNVGNVNVTMKGCDIYDNSPSSSALTVSGTASVSANGAYIVGNYTTAGGGSFTTTPQPTGDGTNVNWSAPIADPYASYLQALKVPTSSDCTYHNQKYNAGATIDASSFRDGQVFCGGLNITGNSTVNFPAGVFYIKDGSLSVGGGSTLNATDGTTFILVGNSTVSFAGGANVDVVADASGPFPGVAFAGDTPASAGNDSFQGGPTMDVTGAVYFPNNKVVWAGGSDTGGNPVPCTQIIAQTIDFKGNAVFGNDCTGHGFPTAGIGKEPTKLVE